MVVQKKDAKLENVVTVLCKKHTEFVVVQLYFISSRSTMYSVSSRRAYRTTPIRLPTAVIKSAMVRYTSNRLVWFLATATK